MFSLSTQPGNHSSLELRKLNIQLSAFNLCKGKPIRQSDTMLVDSADSFLYEWIIQHLKSGIRKQRSWMTNYVVNTVWSNISNLREPASDSCMSYHSYMLKHLNESLLKGSNGQLASTCTISTESFWWVPSWGCLKGQTKGNRPKHFVVCQSVH